MSHTEQQLESSVCRHKANCSLFYFCLLQGRLKMIGMQKRKTTVRTAKTEKAVPLSAIPNSAVKRWALLYLVAWFSSLVVVDSFGFSQPSKQTLPTTNDCIGSSRRNCGDPVHSFRIVQPISALNVAHRQKPTVLNSLVGAGDSWGNLATLSAVGVLAQNLGISTGVGRLLGAPVTAMAITFFLASVGILSPGGTLASRNLQGLAIQFATPWILLGADFGGGTRSNVTSESSSSSSSSSSASTIPLLFGFGLASLASLAGGWFGWRVVGNALVASALGSHNGLAIAAALLAKNIGGGINYVAVCAALKASPEAIAAGLCIDNIGALVYFPISNLLASKYPDPNKKETNPEQKELSSDTLVAEKALPPMTAESISVAFFAASALLWLGSALAVKALNSPSAQIPVVTLLAVLLAGIIAPNAPPSVSKWVPEGLKTTCDTLGTVCLYLFFTTAGAPGIQVAQSMASALWPLSIFSVCLYAVHGGILASFYQLGSSQSSFRKLWKERRRNENDNESGNESPTWRWQDIVSPQRLLVASSSAIGGPPTSVALARTVGWDSLVVPALLVGNIGYAISTFVGIAFYYFFK